VDTQQKDWYCAEMKIPKFRRETSAFCSQCWKVFKKFLKVKWKLLLKANLKCKKLFIIRRTSFILFERRLIAWHLSRFSSKSYYYYYCWAAVCWNLSAFSVFWSYTQSAGLLGLGISPSQGHYLHTEQHKHKINAHNIDIHALNGIRTHDPSFRASEDKFIP
jgi:hypothetical protein